MTKLKIRILNQFGSPQLIQNPKEIEVVFPYESTQGGLKKKMRSGAVKILDGAQGEIEVFLSQFDLDGMPVGDRQNFIVRIMQGNRILSAKFEECLNVRTIQTDAGSMKVISRGGDNGAEEDRLRL